MVSFFLIVFCHSLIVNSNCGYQNTKTKNLSIILMHLLSSLKQKGVMFVNKTYMLDTNVLMRNPNAIFKFEDNNVCLCQITLQELDKNKTKGGETGFSAREAIRVLYSLRENHNTLTDIPINNGAGKFSVVSNYFNPFDENVELMGYSADDVIISTAIQKNAILVTGDISMHLKAISAGCKTEVFKNEQASEKTMGYTGRRTVLVDGNTIDALYSDGSIPIILDANENEYILLKNENDTRQSVIGRYSKGSLYKVDWNLNPYGITPRNNAQRCAIDALMAPVDKIPLVILKGPAGTAKTFLALAAGLQLVKNEEMRRILILRPNIKFDEDIGYLKGDEMDKITPLIRPCLDNLEALLTPTIESSDYARSAVEKLFEKGTVEAEALAYIRGRSIANSYVVVDEAQNSTPNQMLGIISRVGANTKIVITGDPEQIDNPKVDKRNNGLVYAAEKMLNSSLCAQIGFTQDECVRSPLAAEAAKRLAL